eukprot:5867837-Prymnesium_polylepis.1
MRPGRARTRPPPRYTRLGRPKPAHRLQPPLPVYFESTASRSLPIYALSHGRLCSGGPLTPPPSTSDRRRCHVPSRRQWMPARSCTSAGFSREASPHRLPPGRAASL